MKNRLLFVSLLTAVAALFGAPRTQAAERPSLEAAKAAIEDGFYDLAHKQLDAYLATVDRYAPENGEAVVLLVRALHGQGRYDAIVSLIGDLPGRWKGDTVPALVFWKAMASFDRSDYGRAAALLNGFHEAYPTSEYGSRVDRLEAWCALKAGRTNEAFQIFARFDEQYGTTREATANRLDWAQALVTAGDDARAEPLLQQVVAASPASAEGQEARLWMAEMLARKGQWEKAWNLLDLMIADPAVRADRRARAWIAVGELNAAQSNFVAAVSAAAKAAELAPTSALKVRAQAAQGRWLIKSGRIDEGATVFKAVVTSDAGGPLASDMQLELADEYYRGGRYEKAAEEYQNYLEIFTNVAGQARALKGRGSALWSLKRYAEAATVFEKAYVLSSDRIEREQCLFKAAEARFANGQYRLAGETCERILAEFPNSALTPNVLYQLGESLGRQSLWDKAEGRFRSLISRFPDLPLSERALMRIAEMKEEQGPSHIRSALAAYGEVMSVYTNGIYFADALHRRGLIAYQTRDFDQALADFTRVVNGFPKSRVAPQAYYMRGWCLYMMGREDEALAVCRSFVDQFPDAEWMPTVLFWIGEFAFNHADYAEAEKQFGALAGKYPGSPLADRALLWAGRSASKAKEYLRAVDWFTKVATNYPGSSRMAEVRFRQGDALTELGEFARGILLFDELIAKFPDSDLVAAAWGRKGDCQFTLGASDSNRYAEAMASYKAASDARGATPELKLQAQFKLGRCLEKMGKKSESFEIYMKVVYGFLEMETSSRRASPGAAVWFSKAAFAAADLLEADRNWRGAVKVLQRVQDSSVTESGAAKTRIERIRTEHWLW